MKKMGILIFMICIITACYKSNDYEKILDKDILTVSTDLPSIPADGASMICVTAHIPQNADPSKRTITLETNAGKWKEDGQKSINIFANSNGDVITDLQSDLKPQAIRIRASIPTIIIQEVNLSFERAYPETIILDPGCFGLKATFTDTTQVKAILKRQIGKPSEETVVNFSATTNEGAPIGNFRSLTFSDQDGIASVLYCGGATTYRGVVTIKATVDTPNNGVVTANATINIIE